MERDNDINPGSVAFPSNEGDKRVSSCFEEHLAFTHQIIFYGVQQAWNPARVEKMPALMGMAFYLLFLHAGAMLVDVVEGSVLDMGMVNTLIFWY